LTGICRDYTSNADDARFFGDDADLVNVGEQDEVSCAGIFPALTRAQCHRESSLSTSFVLAAVSAFMSRDGERENRRGKDR